MHQRSGRTSAPPTRIEASSFSALDLVKIGGSAGYLIAVARHDFTVGPSVCPCQVLSMRYSHEDVRE